MPRSSRPAAPCSRHVLVATVLGPFILGGLVIGQYMLGHETVVVPPKYESMVAKLQRRLEAQTARGAQLASSLAKLHAEVAALERERATASAAAASAAAAAPVVVRAQPTPAPATAAAATTPAAAAASADCPGRSPYHTLLTAQSSVYQQWQSRIMCAARNSARNSARDSDAQFGRATRRAILRRAFHPPAGTSTGRSRRRRAGRAPTWRGSRGCARRRAASPTGWSRRWTRSSPPSCRRRCSPPTSTLACSTGRTRSSSSSRFRGCSRR